MRKALFGLGLFLVAACGGSSEKDDSESGGPAPSGGENESGGSAAERGGSTSSGGAAASAGTSSSGASTGGSANGGSNRGGATLGGTTSSGGGDDRGGSGAEPGGEGGAAAGMAGSSTTGGVNASGSGGRSGSSGTGGTSGVAPTCDPISGELVNTPYPDCRPRDASDDCELCIEANCCEEARICYGYDPGNVCGWGGPPTGGYAGLNEVDCYVACVRDYVEATGEYDAAADDRCGPACATPACGSIGTATQDLVACIRVSCTADCFLP